MTSAIGRAAQLVARDDRDAVRRRRAPRTRASWRAARCRPAHARAASPASSSCRTGEPLLTPSRRSWWASTRHEARGRDRAPHAPSAAGTVAALSPPSAIERCVGRRPRRRARSRPPPPPSGSATSPASHDQREPSRSSQRAVAAQRLAHGRRGRVRLRRRERRCARSGCRRARRRPARPRPAPASRRRAATAGRGQCGAGHSAPALRASGSRTPSRSATSIASS